MKKKIILAIMVTSMIMSNMTGVYASETQTLELGQTIDIVHEEGNFKVGIDNVHEVEWDYAVEDKFGTKIVTVQGVVENIDFSGIYEGELSAYEISKYGINVTDEEGYVLEFYNISGGNDGLYEVGAYVSIGTKKKVSLPYYAPESCESVFVTIGDMYSMEIPLNSESNSEKEVNESISVTDEELTALQEENSILKEKNAELQDELAALTEENEKLKKQIKELSNSEIKSEENEDTSEETVAESTENEELTNTKEAIVYSDTITIRLTQEALNAAGYNCGTPDGVAGAKTTQALTDYQTAQGITVNGQVTDEVLQKLDIVEKVQKAVEQEKTKNEYSEGYTYEQLARNPDTYMLQKMKFTGKVLQADSSGSVNYIRLAINSDYDTVLFITYEDGVIDYRLLEDDTITIYGQSYGLYSYEAVSGATITIPWIDASIIEMH